MDIVKIIALSLARRDVGGCTQTAQSGVWDLCCVGGGNLDSALYQRVSAGSDSLSALRWRKERDWEPDRSGFF